MLAWIPKSLLYITGVGSFYRLNILLVALQRSYMFCEKLLFLLAVVLIAAKLM